MTRSRVGDSRGSIRTGDGVGYMRVYRHLVVVDPTAQRSLIVELTRISLEGSAGAKCKETPAAVARANRDILAPAAAAESVYAALEAQR
jgi:hypothetical protein